MAWRLTLPQKIRSAKICWESSRLDFFLDQNGILLIDYLPKGQTINAKYYSSLLGQMKDILKEKRSGKVTKGLLFLDNTPAHRALATQKKLAYLRFQRLDHAPNSPDLVPSDYHLFPGLKNQLKGRHFRPTGRSLLPRRPGWTDNLLIFFLSGLQKLQQWAKKCIELRGEYVE